MLHLLLDRLLRALDADCNRILADKNDCPTDSVVTRVGILRF